LQQEAIDSLSNTKLESNTEAVELARRGARKSGRTSYGKVQMWFMEGKDKIKVIKDGEVISEMKKSTPSSHSCSFDPYFVETAKDTKRTFFYQYHQNSGLNFEDVQIVTANEGVMKPTLTTNKNLQGDPTTGDLTVNTNINGIITGSFDLNYNCQSKNLKTTYGN